MSVIVLSIASTACFFNERPVLGTVFLIIALIAAI